MLHGSIGYGVDVSGLHWLLQALVSRLTRKNRSASRTQPTLLWSHVARPFS